MFESTDKGTEFSQWLVNYKTQLTKPQTNTKCILAMVNKMSDKIMIFYGVAEYAGEDSGNYVLKIKSGAHKYSKNNQLLFASTKDFEHFKTTLALKFGETPIDVQKMPVMKTENKSKNPLNELSNELLDRYKTAAGRDASQADARGDYKRGNKRFKGIVKATNKQFANDLKNAPMVDADPGLSEDTGAASTGSASIAAAPPQNLLNNKKVIKRTIKK